MGCCCNASPRPDEAPAPKASGGRAATWRWVRIAIGALLAGQGMLIGLAINTSEAPESTRLSVHLALAAMAAIAFALLGVPLLRDAWRALRSGRLTIEPLFLTALLAAAAFSIVSTVRGEGFVYYETVIVVLVIYSVGTELTGRAQRGALDQIAALASGPATLRRLGADGSLEEIRASDVRPGDVLEVRPGEEIGVDGAVVSGRSLVREATLTGEATPALKSSGDRVLAGTHALDGLLRIRAVATSGARALDRGLRTIDSDLMRRSRLVARANRLLRWFVPTVWIVAIATGVGWWIAGARGEAVMHALAVLLVACPCALGFATPTALWAACLRLMKLGIETRDPDLVEQLASTDTLAIDKTGTITGDRPALTDLVFAASCPGERARVRSIVAAIERRSDHPVAQSLRAIGDESPGVEVRSLRVLPGRGVRAEVIADGAAHDVVIARLDGLESGRDAASALADRLVDRSGAPPTLALIDGVAALAAAFSETPVERWSEAVASLRTAGVRTVVMTGDAPRRAERIEADERHAALTPEQKRDMIAGWHGEGRRVAFVGDGMNDAPALAAADASLAVRDGAPVASAVAHGVIDRAALASLPDALLLARRADRRLRGNLRISVAYNAIGMSAAAAGLLHPVLAAVIMVASSLTVTLRSLSLAEDRADRAPASRGVREEESANQPGVDRAPVPATG